MQSNVTHTFVYLYVETVNVAQEWVSPSQVEWHSYRSCRPHNAGWEKGRGGRNASYKLIQRWRTLLMNPLFDPVPVVGSRLVWVSHHHWTHFASTACRHILHNNISHNKHYINVSSMVLINMNTEMTILLTHQTYYLGWVGKQSLTLHPLRNVH